ncbi:MAG: methyltransferase domain-containing protein [bacterium]|nr:methyltransferase domain-containing protein [bacterium]
MRRAMTALQRLVQLIEATTGNSVPERDHARLGEFAGRRILAGGFEDFDAYVQHLRTQPEDGEWREILSVVTIKESYLFRGRQQFRAISEAVIPDLTARGSVGRRFTVWSAGCARGEEPATLAVVLAESSHMRGWNWQIIASDIDEVALEVAQRGRYSQRAVSHVPEELLQSHFRKVGPDYVLNDELRKRITICKLNLIDQNLPFPDAHFDIILLRNVLIYFSLELQTRVVSRVSGLLKPEGYLFLGSTESLLQIDVDLLPMDHDDCFSYRHRQSHDSDTPSAPVQWKSLAETPLSRPNERQASEDYLKDHGSTPIPQEEEQPKGRMPVPYQEIDDAISEGNQKAAHELVRRWRTNRPSDPALRAAEGWLLQHDGRVEEAIHAYRAALYLEPDLYQIRYQIAQCLDELGARRRAVNELRESANRARKSSRRTLDLPSCFTLPTRETVISEAESLGDTNAG